MFTVSIDPIIFSIGHFMVRWYSLIVLTAILIGLWITKREAQRRGIGNDFVDDITLWLIPAGIVGARLFHVIDHWDHTYAADPLRILYVWQGGLAIWGGIIGGLVALLVLSRRRQWKLLPVLDTLAPGVVLGQGIGRLACVITGDAMGRPTTGPFGFAYTNPAAMVPELGVYYTPTPVYELILNVGIFALLWRLRRHSLPDGMLFLLYLLLYSAGRFLITFWSSYRTIAFGLNQAQLISLVGVSVGIVLIIYLKQRASGGHTLTQ